VTDGSSSPSQPRPRIAERAIGELGRQLDRTLEPGLYLVATPIGNLGDITLRALAVLAGVDTIYCEDTRVTRTLLDHFAIARDLRRYHEHNADAERPRMLAALADGKRLALVSDAGTPLVSDPGYKLVATARDAGHRVIPVPGPSALLASLVAVGLPTDSFLFVGFLPTRSGPRYARLKEIAPVTATLIAYESPQRLTTTVADMAEVLGAQRPAAIARELTKIHETTVTATLGDLAARLRPGADDPIMQRGEIVIVVGPPAERAVDDSTIEPLLVAALATHTVRDAAAQVAASLGVSRSRVYALAVALKNAADGS
jgi:16S rRNA (cytidine1402-2'-O)-methyltransferase